MSKALVKAVVQAVVPVTVTTSPSRKCTVDLRIHQHYLLLLFILLYMCPHTAKSKGSLLGCLPGTLDEAKSCHGTAVTNALPSIKKGLALARAVCHVCQAI